MYLSFLNGHYPVRHTKDEKRAFFEYVQKETDGKARIEQNSWHSNIVIGDPNKAKVIFTAHYDTPWRAFLPNLMLPTNRLLYLAYNISIALVLLAPAIAGSFLILKLFSLDRMSRPGSAVWFLSYLILYVGLFILVMFNGKNRHNYNDNTSGTAAVLELCKAVKDENAAFILFDHEEWGKLGRKAYAKAHPDIKQDTLVINLDCVANGTNFIFAVPDKASGSEIFSALKNCLKDTDAYRALLYPSKNISMNSDQMSFNLGVGVCACKYKPRIGYYCDKIHTVHDTEVSEDNVSYLTQVFSEFLGNV